MGGYGQVNKKAAVLRSGRFVDSKVKRQEMTHPKDPLLQLLNSSGFPFQLRVGEIVAQVSASESWSVLTREHHWEHPASEFSGYIDLVVGYGIIRLVIECKRASESGWIFLVPEAADKPVGRVRSFCAVWAGGGSFKGHGWYDLSVQPKSYEAAFCITKGQDEKSQPMLERIAEPLLQSVEGLAFEEASLVGNGTVGERRVYIPVLVTAASLRVCRFNPAEVDISSGRIDNVEFEEVPFVRFRKGLGQNLLSRTMGHDLAEVNRQKERTLLVIQAKELASFLAGWSINPMVGENWPHLGM